jgi:hypothetical protein
MSDTQFRQDFMQAILDKRISAHHLLGMFLEFMSRDDVEQILNHNNLFLDDFLPDLDNDEE